MTARCFRVLFRGGPFVGGIAVALACGLVGSAGCSLLGTPGSPPGPVPHAGTGQFRALTSDETNVAAIPGGAAIVTGAAGIDNAMAVSGHFFYASATAMPVDAGMRDAGTDAGDAGDPADAGDPLDAGVDASARADASAVDAGLPPERAAVNWDLFDARQIFHSSPRAEWGFTPGEVVLQAEAAWEGGYVTDPWVVERADHSFLLFYAAAGGIGVARSAALAGPYVRDAAPLLAASGADVPRRPSAVRANNLTGAPAGELLVYYELAGQIHVASFDGERLTEVSTLTPTPLAQRDDRDGDEVEVGAPGAALIQTPAGNHVVRVYYESRRSNGTTLIGLMASANGTTFDVFDRPVFAERDHQAPAPRFVDQRTTIVYAWVPFRQGGAIVNAITPASVSLVGRSPTQ